MTKKQKEKFLVSKGWSKWYHDDYWVNAKMVEDPKVQDFTNYGLTLKDAYRAETENWPPFKSVGLPALSRMLYGLPD